MLLKIDFHVHTYYSSDGVVSPEELLKTAKSRGLNTICITDHNTTKGAMEAKMLAEKIGINVIIGQETTTREGEILAYGIEKTLPCLKEPEETCKLAKKLGGYIALPHPYDKMRRRIENREKIIKYLDAVETFNSRCLFSRFNKKAEVFARKNNLPMIAGSDAHFRHEIGNAINILRAEPNAKSIFSALKKEKQETITKKFQMLGYIRSTLKRKIEMQRNFYY